MNTTVAKIRQQIKESNLGNISAAANEIAINFSKSNLTASEALQLANFYHEVSNALNEVSTQDYLAQQEIELTGFVCPKTYKKRGDAKKLLIELTK